MQAIEQKITPMNDAKYCRYSATQRRVARWVEQTSQSQYPNDAMQETAPKSRRSFSSRSRSHKRSRQLEVVGFTPSVPKLLLLPGYSALLTSDIGVYPAVALLSSSVLMFAILPSLIAISVFAVVLTYACLQSERPIKDNHRGSRR